MTQARYRYAVDRNGYKQAAAGIPRRSVTSLSMYKVRQRPPVATALLARNRTLRRSILVANICQ